MTAVSLLSRIILPRPGEPLDVRKLYVEESTTNARRAHATTRTSLQIGAASEVSFATYFNAFPASYWRRWSICKSVVLRVGPDPDGKDARDVTVVPIESVDEGTDRWAIEQGYVSMTPLRLDLTDEKALAAAEQRYPLDKIAFG